MTRECKQCGKVFEPYNKNTKYCSKECRNCNIQQRARDEAKRAYGHVRCDVYQPYKERLAEIKAWINELKTQPCVDCGNKFDPVCMDFDHREPGAKVAGIAVLVNSGNDKEIIQKELEKCDLVCSNCHRVRTRNRPRKRKDNRNEE